MAASGLIPDLVQWVKDPALLPLWYRLQLRLRFKIPGLGSSVWVGATIKKKKKKKIPCRIVKTDHQTPLAGFLTE